MMEVKAEEIKQYDFRNSFKNSKNFNDVLAWVGLLVAERAIIFVVNEITGNSATS